MGLWMMDHSQTGERVAMYTGDELTVAEAVASDSAYLLMVNKNLVLDVADPTHAPGRFINCGRLAGKTVNAASALRDTRPPVLRQGGPTFRCGRLR